MADENQVIVPKQSKIDAENKAAETQKGSQRLPCYVWADPNSAFLFELPERAIDHFKIDRTAEGMPDNVKLYQPKSVKAATNVKLKREGGTAQRRGQLIYKAITFPTGETDPIKKKGKAIKSVRVRVPSAMSINAIAVWVNNQFKQNKPEYFFTQSGTKVYIQKDYKDKSKLNDIGKKG